MKKAQKKIIANAISASIENHRWCCQGEVRKRNIVYKLKYIVWFTLLIFLSPRKKVTCKKFVCAMTPVNEKRLLEYTDDELYRFAKLNNTLGQMKSNRSIFSPYTRGKRCLIALKGIAFFLQFHKKLKGYIHFTLEYYAIAYFILDKKPDEIVSPFMYERYCSFLSHLGHDLRLKLTGVQDGAAVDIKVPVKIYCDIMYAFDEFEARIIKMFMANKNCEFICTGFKSNIKWKKYNKGEKKLIAIASQDWFTQKTIQLIDVIMGKLNHNNLEVIVFPHYREKTEQYSNICKKYPGLILCPKDRYENIDLLITFYSTIVYDFWSVNKDLYVMCLHIPGYEPGYYGRGNVTVFDDFQELSDAVLKVK